MPGPYRWDAAGTLILTALAIMGTPGPATISLTAAGSAYGMRRSLAYLAGIVAGTAAVLLAVATGITAALLALPAVRPALIAAGAAYILWLAFHIATAPPLAEGRGGPAPPGLAGGAFLGVANPKAWIAIAAVFASARLVARAVPPRPRARPSRQPLPRRHARRRRRSDRRPALIRAALAHKRLTRAA
jgi:threonine/homoserine/homoserine lactone efflux protein